LWQFQTFTVSWCVNSRNESSKNPSTHYFYMYILKMYIRSIHWPCHCTVHVYVVIHFCDSTVVFLSAIRAGFFLSFVYMYCRWRSRYQKGGGWGPINRFNSATFLCPFHTRTWISNVICRGLFVFSDFI
jgi:hypothetical protein